MGSLTSRQNAGVEEVDIVSNHAYKYPPRSGNYFGSHFIMGGERFDTPQPEAYLFGENTDLNFLGSKPTPFPYPPPQANDPTRTLKSLINIRKESLRLVRNVEKSPAALQQAAIKNLCTDVQQQQHGGADLLDCKKPQHFNLEFTFDCDVKCSITIYYFCAEEVSAKGVTYVSRDPLINSETYYYKRGANQLFSQTSHVFDPSLYSDEELSYNVEREIIPIAIHCVAEEGVSDEPKQSHATIAVVEKHSDGLYVLKALKQKLFVDGLCYLLQEIYGIENKNTENAKQQANDEDAEDNGAECVICMCDVRDTLILPCRHLCLCNGCADSLRYQANNCPICRAPFRALLQIKALQKAMGSIMAAARPPLPEESCENIPAGYEAVSLIEALNGPYTPRASQQQQQQQLLLASESPDTPDTDTASATEAAQVLNRSTDSKMLTAVQFKQSTFKDSNSLPRSSSSAPTQTSEFRMSVLLAKGENSGSHQDLHHRNSPIAKTKSCSSSHPRSGRDTLRLVNEKQQSALCLYETQNQDEDSEAEKLSPLLDASASVEATTGPARRRRDAADIDDDELPNGESDNKVNISQQH